MDKVRLTQMVTSAGCAAKLFPYLLSDILKDIDWKTNENVLVGLSGKDDAGVYKINDDLALIHTTDFFTPVVDDPFVFGQIAVANSLSDVYAMGGKPINALNIVAFPQNKDNTILKEILKGGADKANEANCIIIGGHSIDIQNIIYGLAVTGTIAPKDIKGNNNAKPGDVLILTKALGTGILNNAVKYKSLEDNQYLQLINSMRRLNKNAAEKMVDFNASACTDVTGFGLAGHSMHIAVESNVVLHFIVKNLPVLEGAEWAVNEKLLTRGDKSNRIYTEMNVKSIGTIDTFRDHLIYDPQTSGGLLISVSEKYSFLLLDALQNSGEESARIVGYVDEPNSEIPSGTLIFDYN